MVAQDRQDYDDAEKWYHKSLGVRKRLGDEHEAAQTYHQLGMVAQARRDYDAAENWYHKSLEVAERLRDEQGAAITYHQLGMVAQARQDFLTAARWALRAVRGLLAANDRHNAAIVVHEFLRAYRQLPESARPALDADWQKIPGLPPIAVALAQLPPES
jgi:tetratricopeptide (TPR) repeat protein